jgi:hypothetical protein
MEMVRGIVSKTCDFSVPCGRRKKWAKMFGVIYLFFLNCLVYTVMEGMTVENYGVGWMWRLS